MTALSAHFPRPLFNDHPLSPNEKNAFRQFLLNSLCDRLPVIAQTLAFFQVWMLVKDLIRYQQGTLLVDVSHRHLFYAHLTLSAFWPFLLLRRRQALIRSGQYPAVRYWLIAGFVLFHLQALYHSVLAYRDRGSLIIYFLMLAYFQIVFLWTHRVRTVSALLGLLVVGFGIWTAPLPGSRQLSDLSDLLLATLLVYWISTVFFNARLRSFRESYDLANNVEQSAFRMGELQTQHEQVVTELDKRNRELTGYTLQELAQGVHEPMQLEARWRHFKLLFEDVHPAFWKRTAEAYPVLSIYEIKLVALLRMNLTTKEIADVLGISAQSANTARYRLRKKLSLQPDQDLEAFVRNL